MSLLEIAELLNLPDNFKRTFVRTAEHLIDNAELLELNTLCLFGSTARGDFNGSSDLDFLVITNAARSSKISVIVESLDLRDDVGVPGVDIIVRTKKELSDKEVRFNREVLKDAIVLWESC